MISIPPKVLRQRAGLITVLAVPFVALWWMNPDAYVADDSYFYLEIAKNIVRDGSLTFSGFYPTNGFHPLWLVVLTAYTAVVDFFHPEWLDSARYAVPLSGLMLLTGTFLLGRFAREQALSVAIVVTPVLCFLAGFGVLYSEAHLVFVCLAVLLLVVGRDYQSSLGRAVAIAVACCALFLSRLDLVFVVATIYIWYLVEADDWKYAILSGFFCVLLVTPYLITNIVWFGGLTPISGYLKSTFPEVNYEGLIYTGGLVVRFLRINVIFGIIPLAAACWAITSSRPGDEPKDRRILLAAGAGVMMQLMYTGLFTWGHTNWYWYYVPAVVLGTWTAGYLAERWSLSEVTKALIAVPLVMSFVAFSASRIDDQWPTATARAIEFIRSNVPDSTSVFVTERPGRTAFFTESNIIAADMLTSNRKFYRKMKGARNAFEFLKQYSRAQGEPLEFIVYNGGFFADVSDGELTYYDPRMTTLKRRVIGRISVDESVYRSEDTFTVAWRVH